MSRLISFLADPRLEVPLMLALAVMWWYRNGAPVEFLSLLLFIDAGLPGWFYGHLWQKKEISDGDITERKERLPLYWFTTISHLAGVGVAAVFGQWLLAQVLGVFWVLALVFTLITTKWKISVHMGVNTALVIYLMLSDIGRYFGLCFVMVSVVWLMIVGWSRWSLKRHSLAQIIAGVILAGTITWVGLGVVL